MPAPSLAGAIAKRPWLRRLMQPLSNWYCQAAGYRQLGLKADDLIPEESEMVLLALKRLSEREAYDRVFRLRRAFQASLSHQLLPRDQWTKPEEDRQYLSPILAELEAEERERADMESLQITKRK